MAFLMVHRESPQAETGGARRTPSAIRLRGRPRALVASLAILVVGLATALAGLPSEWITLLLAAAIFEGIRRLDAQRARLEDALARVSDDACDLAFTNAADLPDRWRREWPARATRLRRAETLLSRASVLPPLVEERLGRLTDAADRQEEAIEETASLVANMRQSMREVADQVDHLRQSSDQSASSIHQLGRSIDQVADGTASLHERVEASTSSVHEMSASIRQVATSAEQVQEMAETTAVAVGQMDRSIQEVSNHAVEAATLTDRAREGATDGHRAVRSTIEDIERISTLTTDAMERLDGLVNRLAQIGSILGAIDEINDETNLLSLNAAIIAAQAGEQGKAFLVVANHVKTLARRTASSTQDIERLIGAIHEESSRAVDAMRAGIDAVRTGVERSQGAGAALEAIQEACSEASERVAEIARSTAEQSRNSKGVAESTQQTSAQIQQISQAIEEQSRASESMLENSESALASCLSVRRATDEQRQTSRHITESIGGISELIREIGLRARTHAEASEATGETVTRLLENAQATVAHAAPLRELFDELTPAASPDAPLPSEAEEEADARAARA